MKDISIVDFSKFKTDYSGCAPYKTLEEVLRKHEYRNKMKEKTNE